MKETHPMKTKTPLEKFVGLGMRYRQGRSMRTVLGLVLPCAATVLFALALGLPIARAQDQNQPGLRVTSTTFVNGGTLPLSMVFNQCSFYPGGGNQSPELSWRNAPDETRSFVVIAYDVTASFTHWGMYNISSRSNGLPLNAGTPNNPDGTQVANDFGDLSYDGPCPPPPLTPVSHTYVFTVYALDIVLPTLPTFGDFSPGSQALYHALITAARGNHILDSTSIVGHFP